eukprot:GHVH01004383.1.p1 GENE.GHVH01004383.1~~GHVH01004383.1.p1  ORF type:complete len:540 (+),score=77.62 GHVH01004383.1:209-1828(+)
MAKSSPSSHHSLVSGGMKEGKQKERTEDGALKDLVPPATGITHLPSSSAKEQLQEQEQDGIKYWKDTRLAPIEHEQVESIGEQRQSLPVDLPHLGLDVDESLRIVDSRAVEVDVGSDFLSKYNSKLDEPRKKRFDDIVEKISKNPQWDFEHNNVMNLSHQSSANWNVDLLSPSASKIFKSVITQETTGRQKKKATQKNNNEKDFYNLVVWFDRSMVGERRGEVRVDMLWSKSDRSEFFEDLPIADSGAAVDTPITIQDFLVQAETRHSGLPISLSPTRDVEDLNHVSTNFLTQFPSFSNVRIADLTNPSKAMIFDLAESLRRDVAVAFMESICSHRYTREKQVGFIERFLKGHRYERFRVQKKYSKEVVNISKFPIPLHRKWAEFVIAVAEELPAGRLHLTEGLSKNDEMRFVYQIFGIYTQLCRRNRGVRSEQNVLENNNSSASRQPPEAHPQLKFPTLNPPPPNANRLSPPLLDAIKDSKNINDLSNRSRKVTFQNDNTNKKSDSRVDKNNDQNDDDKQKGATRSKDEEKRFGQSKK